MDWKLPGSGEDFLDDKRITNNYLLTRRDSVKFTISDQRDYETAKEVYEDYIIRKDTRQTKLVGTPTRAAEVTPQVFAGVAWGKLANADLVKWMQHDGLPWRLNVQVHNYIWNREQRGI
jgi:organic radical activating enzyme